MNRVFWVVALLFLGSGKYFVGHAQIDPEKRQLFQFGYNQPVEGRAPIAGYLFYYRNDPGFWRSNVTLRLAIAPIYIDSELGFSHALGSHTDFAVGLAGGGFADSYYEIRRGKLLDRESYLGHGGEMSASLYHLFNPNRLIPLNGIIRVSPHYSVYQGDTKTDNLFVLPSDHVSFNVRTGLRWGGREPTVWPDLGLELSIWYEGQFRTEAGTYGYRNDRRLESAAHLFWTRALLIYTSPELHHNFGITFTAGTSVDVDRFSAYRIGGVLPLVSEFPLSLPGYYFQELTARSFVLWSGQYSIPIDHAGHWNATAYGSVASVDFLGGLDQPGHFHSGVGLGMRYRPNNTWQIVLAYGYGFQALRQHGYGAQNIGLLFQWDFEAKRRPRDPYFDIQSPSKSRGLFQILTQ